MWCGTTTDCWFPSLKRACQEAEERSVSFHLLWEAVRSQFWVDAEDMSGLVCNEFEMLPDNVISWDGNIVQVPARCSWSPDRPWESWSWSYHLITMSREICPWTTLGKGLENCIWKLTKFKEQSHFIAKTWGINELWRDDSN